ncbi:MAG: glycoside hydrolase family 38 C-terminal domain-containing protein [Candidatus Faecivicinus sp.]
MKNVHMIANAHLDPVWLWRWEEGCAEALATFRTAADLIDEYDGFAFCHNEALLYEWVKENDPILYERIRAHVRAGRWHIIGGWYLQPDCNMPSGEAMIRNIQRGRRFFRREFGVTPTTAINFDSFGHARGLVQILNQAGYQNYVVCRPAADHYPFREQDFIWRGFDGSSVVVHRSDENYNSVYGHLLRDMKPFLEEKKDEPVTLFLWGVGDHGGGPSRVDLDALQAWQREDGAHRYLHSSPEAYFEELKEHAPGLPEVAEGLNPVAPGCYTSQIRVKQRHRELENLLFAVERMCTAAHIQTGMPYPEEELSQAERDLTLAEFHDALPGSGTQLVEEDTLRQLDHGLEILHRVRMRAFWALGRGEESIVSGTSVVLAYNPHPFAIEGPVEFECATPWQNWDPTFMAAQVCVNGRRLPAQNEMESSHFCIDWRKKVAVHCTLPAMSMTRFEVRFEPLPRRPVFAPLKSDWTFDNGSLRAAVSLHTGRLSRLQYRGKDLLAGEAFGLCAYDDTYNSWGIKAPDRFGAHPFALLDAHEGSAFCGLQEQTAHSVRVVEDGPVRTVVEALTGWHDSRACIRYSFYPEEEFFDVDVFVYWNEKDHYLKLEIPTCLTENGACAQKMLGVEPVADPEETVMQKWCAAEGAEEALAVINRGVYGMNACDGCLGLTLLRSAGYSAADGDYEKTLHEVRFAERMEQGERKYAFRVLCGSREKVMREVSRRAEVFNMPPYALACNPPHQGERAPVFAQLDAQNVQITAMKMAADGGVLVRMVETQGEPAEAALRVADCEAALRFAPWELKTVEIRDGRCEPHAMLEE